MRLSIIIPVYNTGEYLGQCVDSVLRQTFRDYEIIIVDDGSNLECREEIERMRAKDERIHILRHTDNQGLFAARVTGMREAKGDYLAFLDSDDAVSIDYYRVMVSKAIAEKVDMVIGRTAEKEGYLHMKNLHEAAFTFERLEGEELQRQFWEQEGNCFAWHTVWNKLYSRRLVEVCLPYFERVAQHLVMTEDVAFSSVFFLFASKACFVHSGAYYYIHRTGNSTDAEQMTLKKYKKSIHDLSVSFSFVQGVLEETGQPEWKKNCFQRFRALYARRWKGVQSVMAPGEDRGKAQEALAVFEKESKGWKEAAELGKEDYFYHTCKTGWDNRLEELRELVVYGAYRYISFDIFDTILTRPFTRPQDLYRLMNPYFHSLCESYADFYEIRIHGEKGCRKEQERLHPKWQDVTVDEIYDYIGRVYGISDEVCRNMMQLERELEVKYSGCRSAMKEIYDLAILSGKKVIFISDMYLEEGTIRKLLHKAGCLTFERLFLSSKDRKVKWTGDLYRLALRELQIEPFEILHIGDNPDSDIAAAKQVGIPAFYVPRTIQLFEEHCLKPIKYLCGNVISRNIQDHSIGYACMQALAANKYFDHPFRPFHRETDYNMDPYLIGYHAVGMHLAGLVKWMVKVASKNDYQRIVFTSRDGYLPMLAYEKYRTYDPQMPEAIYLSVSRKSIMPLMLKEEADFFELPILMEFYSPKTWLELLQFCLREDYVESIEAESMKAEGIDLEQKFTNREDYHRFITYFLQRLYSKEKHKKKIAELREYFKRLRPGDLIFDMGYSGRIQSALCEAAGQKLDAMFLYGNHELAQREHLHHFHVYRFYELQPDAPDYFREYLLSEPEPSCVDYKRTQEGAVPVYDDRNMGTNESFIIKTIQRAAMDFLDDFYGQFFEKRIFLPFSPQEVSLPLEGFLRFSSRMDRHIFEVCRGEDRVYSAREGFSLEEFLAGQYQERKSMQELLYELEGIPDGVLDIVKGRKIVLFGTGKVFERICARYPQMQAAFYLDNNLHKNGKLVCGNVVLHPSVIKDWAQLFIVITTVSADDIARQLEGFGLKRGHDFIDYKELDKVCVRRD